MGATLGLLEYLSQSNNSADCVSEEDRFKFVDDLTILEIINLLNIGISSLNIKSQVPSDLPVHGQYIEAGNLQTQSNLDNINIWTVKQQMLINERKTKTMIFNYTNNYQFTTRLKLNNVNLEVINEAKILGTILTNDLKWDKNTQYLVKKANKRMQLLRKLASFGAPTDDLKTIYILYIRNILEQSSTVWHSMLTLENREYLERVQKSCFRILLGKKLKNY